MNIVAIRLDKHGCGNYRVTWPLWTLTSRGHNVKIIQAEEGKRLCNHDLAGDVLIVQRQNDQSIYDMVDSLPPAYRPVTIYETDDLVWKLPAIVEDRDGLREDLRRTVPPMLERADAVIASTPELASECRSYNPLVHTVLNSIDLHIRDWSACHPPVDAIRGRKVIGWSGSGWHAGDLDCVGSALGDVLRDHPDWCFVCQGDAPRIRSWIKRLKLPGHQTIVLGWMTLETHPSIYSLFDIGIAPLAINDYNRSKSELKLIELGARGIPWVASSIAPYIRFGHLAGSGFCVRNPGEWGYFLNLLVSNEDLRKRMGGHCYDVTHINYAMEDRVIELEMVLLEILNERRNSGQGFASPVSAIQGKASESNGGDICAYG